MLNKHEKSCRLYNEEMRKNRELCLEHLNPYSAEVDFRRQNLTSKVDPRAVILHIFIMAVDPQHRYLNESQRRN